MNGSVLSFESKGFSIALERVADTKTHREPDVCLTN